ALALEQSIGRHRRAHLDGANLAGRDGLTRPEAEELADAVHGGIAIGLRVLREQLVGDQRAVRPPPDHIGERAATVDPEIPAAVAPAARLHCRSVACPSAALYGRKRPRRSLSEARRRVEVCFAVLPGAPGT